MEIYLVGGAVRDRQHRRDLRVERISQVDRIRRQYTIERHYSSVGRFRRRYQSNNRQEHLSRTGDFQWSFF